MRLFERYLNILSSGNGGKQNSDLIFPNICVQDEKWTMIDYEWTSAGLSAEDIARRALHCYGLENTKRTENPIVKKAMEKVGLDEVQKQKLAEREIEFQRSVMREKDGRSRTALTDMRHLIGNRAVPWQEFFARADRKKVQIFEDFGGGYTPEHSYYKYDAYEADDLIHTKIECQAGTKGIRLDPAELPCLVQIHKIVWRGRELTKEETDRCMSTNGEVLDAQEGRVSTVLFDTVDPNISVRLDALDGEETAGETLEIKAQIAWLTGEMLADIRARIGRAEQQARAAQEELAEHRSRRKGFWFQK